MKASLAGSMVLFSAAGRFGADNVLTSQEKAAGSQLLFDGNMLNGWTSTASPAAAPSGAPQAQKSSSSAPQGGALAVGSHPRPCSTSKGQANLPEGASHWEIVSGSISPCGDPASYLASKASYHDFILRVDFRTGEDTNSVSGRVQVGEVGFTIELGRPGAGVWFREIQEMACELARAGVAFEKKNPVTALMSDVSTGTIRQDILNEKVLSAIIEVKVRVERTEEIIRLVWDVEERLDTVVALGVGTRCDPDGEERTVAPILERLGYKLERAKTNTGMGRITNPAAPVSQSEVAIR